MHLPAARHPLPCVSLGPVTARQRWPDINSAHWVSMRACQQHGTCTVVRPIAATPCCETCPDYSPDRETLIAPLGSRGQPHAERGRIAKKTWEYPYTLCLAHLDTLELLDTVLTLWRLQTIPPYIVLVDTGSSAAVCQELERFRAVDCEIHYIRRHSWFHTSAAVGAALDLCHSLADTDFILHSHLDVFPRLRDLAAWLLSQCSATVPAVGWQMSPRVGREDWRGMISHTCTVLERRTILRSGARWSLALANDWCDTWGQRCNGWPDTETAFNLGLQKAGIPVKLLGAEINFERQTTDWYDHCRSYTRTKYDDRSEVRAFHEAKVLPYTLAALAEAKERVATWQEEISNGCSGTISCSSDASGAAAL